MSESNTKGLDELRRKVDELDGKMKALEGEHHVLFSELFPPQFLHQYTSFTSLDDLEQKAQQNGFTLDTLSGFTATPQDKWDEFIAQHSQFGSWQEMMNVGAADYARRQISL